MKSLRALAMFGVLCLCSSAQAASITRVITTTTEHGTAKTEVTRQGNTITARTTYQPSKQTYQPMGSGSYRPMGSSSYNPMGR